MVLFEQAVARGQGGANNPDGLGGKSGKTKEEQIVNRDNVTVDNTPNKGPDDRGNAAGYAIRKLSKDQPDLLEQVKAGGPSAHGHDGRKR